MNKQRCLNTTRDGDKMFDLLEALAEHDCLTLPALASALRLPKGAVLRLVTMLEPRQMVEYDTAAGVCRLGLNAFRFSQNILKNNCLLRIAHPVMEELARKLDEATYMTVMHDDEVLFLDMVDSLQRIRTVPLVGCRFPFFTNAAGKAIKAMSSYDLLERTGRRRTNKTGIQDIGKLEQELLDIRQRGVAVDTGGLDKDICSVAATVRDYAGKVVGALTVLAPSFRMVQERIESEIIPSVQEGAELLSMKFGYSKLTA